jgi:hypothetical protein
MPHQVEDIQIIGALDLDTPPQVFNKGFFSDARNVIFRGSRGNMRVENSPGTRNIPNPYLPIVGQNKKIGAFYDDVNQQIIEFNCNSAGNHGIYILNTQTEKYQILCQNGVNTDGDILGFDADLYITSVDIIYGDGGSGDLLFYVDSLGRPTKLNIQRYLANTYPVVYRSYIDVAKAPVDMPLQCVYENDLTATNNNLLNALYQFCATNIYDDNEESVLNTGSKTPLPTIAFNAINTSPVTINSRIAVYVQTGSADIKAIRIYGRQTKDGATTGWFIIATLDKAALGIASNSIYRYEFKNDGNYVDADPAFTVVDQDFVPQKTQCQALLNVSTISYANITEGYNYIPSTFSITGTGAAFTPSYFTVNGVLFFAFQPKGSNQITLYLTGVGTNNVGTNMPQTLDSGLNSICVRAKVGGTDISFDGGTIPAGQAIATTLAALSAAAVIAGFTVVSTSANSLTISLSNVVLQSTYIQDVDTLPPNLQVPTFYPYSGYSMGVRYRDGEGRTNGVITDVTANFKTGAGAYYLNFYGLFSLLVNLSGITPPSWAKTYDLMRTDTLTYAKYLDWISSGACASVSQYASNQYAYIQIDNILDYNLQLQSTEAPVSYAFSPGDRVKITGLYSAAGVFTVLNYDYEIIAVVSNPVLEGIQKTGVFIQINYPAADVAASSGTFQFVGSPTFSGNTANFQNYQILIYALKAHNAAVQGSNENVYHAVGETYKIGNPGTPSAYHMGNVADNQIGISDGDVFLRTRTVPSGATYYLPSGNYKFGDQYTTFLVNFDNSGNATTTPNYVIGYQSNTEVPGNNTPAIDSPASNYPIYSNNALFSNVGANPISIRIRGKYTLSLNAAAGSQTSSGMYIKMINTATANQIIQIVPEQKILQPATNYDFDFDATFSVPAGYKAFIIASNLTQAPDFSGLPDLTIGQFTLRLDVLLPYTINVYDASFNDTYNIITNSDSKPGTQDTTAVQANYNTLFRFSQPYQLGTNINGTNRFYFNNFDEFEKQWGGVMRMKTHDKTVRIFQYRKCGVIGVYANFIKDNSGTQQLITTDTIITPNNIQYYEGDFGIGNQAAALVSSGYADYFPDPVKGFLLRLSRDGIVPISDLYKAQTWAGANLTPYINNQNPYRYGGYAKIIGTFFNPPDRTGEFICAIQYGMGYGIYGSPIGGESLSFNEKDNAFTSKLDFAPDYVLGAENKLYSWYGGATFIHDNVAAYNTFYGVKYDSEVEFISKEIQAAKKEPLSISLQSPYPRYMVNVPLWVAPVMGDVRSSTGQDSNLVEEDFDFREGVYHGAFQRDNTGQYGTIDGDYLKGEWFKIRLRNNSADLTFLSSLYLNYLISPRNG